MVLAGHEQELDLPRLVHWAAQVGFLWILP